VGRHRHTPEIEQELGGDLRVTFTPHLVPIAHGELVSCYVTPAAEADVAALYADAYAEEPWVEVVEGPPGMQEVRETNFCRVSVHRDERTGRIIVFATIDNLWKGTSSQAVQNLNLMFGRPESEGLT
jgi:N-acetyl-gamma-glutamyl-phosphate reductase